ncbi:glucose PTS transporter subunit IIA [Schaalia hyovaginalis]|uniref:PTS system glucose-specific IIA component n=1 Tax=Schaalia hyovaginalis TaxID=29316 RepID=A0A923J058_9ACTO|nr:glucose PTS transporter subunit IIA [Schaalia hyovaginalis]MBB6335494.1 PTS system glucose-specific IIA component [Schaalia hyovaginalis]MDY2669625.1 glucose PTS transporter subunit IIA [Schaalia hyovaginalis]
MFTFGRKKVQIAAPFVGEVVEIGEVPDPVFSSGVLGPGLAVIPEPDAAGVDVCSPVKGRLIRVFRTLHAFVLVTEGGLEVLVHIGLDTVELGGAGFESLVPEGTEVMLGQPIIRFDVAAVRASGRNPITPVVFSKRKQVAEVKAKKGRVIAGEPAAVAFLA